MLPSIPLSGIQPAAEQSTAQFVIPAGAGATYSATAANIATVTFNAAHGLTMTPAAGVLPNYFISFGGSTSAPTGTGILVGNVFRILSIPSTTAITIYCTLSALTVTSLTGIPVFFPSFTVGSSANIGGEPTQTISTVVTKEPFPILGECDFMLTTGANCVLSYNPDQTLIALDATTTAALPGGTTPTTAPTLRTLQAASSQGQWTGAYPWCVLMASGTTATTRLSITR